MTDAPQAAAPQEKVSAFGLSLLVLSLPNSWWFWMAPSSIWHSHLFSEN